MINENRFCLLYIYLNILASVLNIYQFKKYINQTQYIFYNERYRKMSYYSMRTKF